MQQFHRTTSALVVEGGAMRGIFASGVLDIFHERQHRPFDFCIGVSAGALALASWLAGQHLRNYRVITDHSCRPEFIRFSRFFRGGHMLDLDWMFDICAKEIPLDYLALEAQSTEFYVVTTRVDDGQAVYNRATADRLDQLLKASCSVPVVYRHYPEIDGIAMADGGVGDSIPVIEAYNRGARDITVVLSQPEGYRKGPPASPWLVRKSLAQAPRLVDAVLNRHERYNRAIDFINKPPGDCKVKVIAPPNGFRVGRFTKDRHKLHEGYLMGRQAADLLWQATPPMPAGSAQVLSQVS